MLLGTCLKNCWLPNNVILISVDLVIFGFCWIISYSNNPYRARGTMFGRHLLILIGLVDPDYLDRIVALSVVDNRRVFVIPRAFLTYCLEDFPF